MPLYPTSAAAATEGISSCISLRWKAPLHAVSLDESSVSRISSYISSVMSMLGPAALVA